MCVWHSAAGNVCLAGCLRGRDQSHVCCWDTLSAVCYWPWSALTAAGCLELSDKNRFPHLYTYVNEYKPDCPAVLTLGACGPKWEAVCLNWVNTLKPGCVSALAAGLGEFSAAGKSCRTKGVMRWHISSPPKTFVCLILENCTSVATKYSEWNEAHVQVAFSSARICI